MEKTPIGLIIKKIIEEKNFSITDLAEQLGMSRATVYTTFGRDRMKKADIEKWAKVLDVSTEELKNQELYGHSVPAKNDFGSETLDAIKRLLEEELREKNEQIRSLQESLKESQRLASALLGKLHEYPTSPVMTVLAAPTFVGAIA